MQRRLTRREESQKKKREKKNPRRNLSPWDTSSSTNEGISPETVHPGNLRIIRLTGVPGKNKVKAVADILEKLGKPRDWAEAAHYSNGRARLEVYTGSSKAEANEIARQLKEAGATLVRY